MLNKEQVKAQQKQQLEKLQADASKYHQLFVQNPIGVEIFQSWIEQYVFGGFTPNDATTSELAKAEARREFVVMITQKIQLAENIS